MPEVASGDASTRASAPSRPTPGSASSVTSSPGTTRATSTSASGTDRLAGGDERRTLHSRPQPSRRNALAPLASEPADHGGGIRARRHRHRRRHPRCLPARRYLLVDPLGTHAATLARAATSLVARRNAGESPAGSPRGGGASLARRPRGRELPLRPSNEFFSVYLDGLENGLLVRVLHVAGRRASTSPKSRSSTSSAASSGSARASVCSISAAASAG